MTDEDMYMYVAYFNLHIHFSKQQSLKSEQQCAMCKSDCNEWGADTTTWNHV